MFKPLHFYLGLRYFSAGSQRGFLASFISALAVVGLVLGVALLIIVMAVMNGFDRELRQRILSVVPHVQLLHRSGVALWQDEIQQIAGLPRVQEVTPFNQVDGLLHHRNLTQPVQLLGLSAEHWPQGLGDILREQQVSPPRENQLLLSAKLAQALNLEPGQRVTLIYSRDVDSPAQAFAFELAATFETHTEMDRVLAIADMAKVGEVAGFGDLVGGFRVQVDEQFAAREIGYELLRQLPYGYAFRDWFQTHGNLYQAIQMSRNLVGLLIFLIVAIAAFNVVSMLMMSVVEKRRDVAILQTLGLSRAGILKLFLTQGALIGFFGISLGVVLGVLGCQLVADLVGLLEALLGSRLLNTDIYPIDYVPVDLRLVDVLTIVLVAMVLNVLATIYPAIKASQVAPAEELRYE